MTWPPPTCRLHYRSERTAGRAALAVPLAGTTVAPQLERIDVRVTLAGRTFTRSLAPEAHLRTVFAFDGPDAEGQLVDGAQPVTVEVAEVRRQPAGGPPLIQRRWFRSTTGHWNSRAQGLGGWSLDVHHFYDPVERVLSYGDGSRRTADTMGMPVVRSTGSNETELLVARGQVVDVFHPTGRHLRTVHALTGATLYAFTYTDGLLTAITDGDGNVTTIAHDGAGNPTAIVGPFGQETILGTDANGYLTTVTNPAEETWTFAYAESGGQPFDTQGDGLLVTMRDPRLNEWEYEFDTQGRLTRAADPAGGFKTLERSETAAERSITVTTGEGRVTTATIAYGADGEKTQTHALPSGLQRVMEVSADRTHRETTAPDGTTTETDRTPDPRFGNQVPLVQSTMTLPGDPALSLTVRTERTVTLAEPDDPLSVTAQTETTTVNGRTTTTAYTAGPPRTIITTSPAGRTVTMVLDEQGRPVQISVPGMDPVELSYTPEGFLDGTAQGSGGDARVITLSYDEQGRLESITDPLERSTAFTYDDADRVETQTLPGDRVVGFTYDANGNLQTLTPPGRPAHAFAYTPMNLQSEYLPPEPEPTVTTRQTTYGYNTDRQLETIARPDGQRIELVYDATGRLQAEQVAPDAEATPVPVLEYDYDSTGTVGSITRSDGASLAFGYVGSLPASTTWSGAVSGSVSHDYDNDLRVQSQSVNGGASVTFTYDDDGLLTGAGALTLTRNADNGRLEGTELPADDSEATIGGIADSYTYNGFGEVIGYTATLQPSGEGSPTALFSVTYERDKLGRIEEKTETIDSVSTTTVYGYDAAGRLRDVTTSGTPTAHYRYDANGNRLPSTTGEAPETAFTGNGELTAATYDDQDRLLSYTIDTGSGSKQYAFGYTANGELLSKTVTDLTTSGVETTGYSYDVFGNLRIVALPDGRTIEYVIDALNRRVGRKVSPAPSETPVLVQQWLYQDQLNPVVELDGEGNVVSRFVYGTKVNVPDYMIKAGVTYRIVSDHLGSPRFVVNMATGELAQALSYDEFGNVLEDSNPEFQPFGLAGGLYDRTTSFVRFGARDYDPGSGRWLAKDPIGFRGGDLNLYQYASNDPINQWDLAGLSTHTKTYNESETLAILADVRDAATTQGLLGLVFNHNFGRFDYADRESLSRFKLDGREYSASEFGNYIAGYAGVLWGDVLGYNCVRAGGIAWDLLSAAADRPLAWWGGVPRAHYFDNDADSLPDIQAGATRAWIEILLRRKK